MALNFTVSYTFSPNTTISSSQVNTNTSDVAAVFQGLEAETKTLAKLKVDVDPTSALEVATKQYVDHYSTYRKPVILYNSGTVVNIETGNNGSSGVARVLFPDGDLRTDSTTTRINCDLTRVYANSGTAQSGLQSGTVAANNSYCMYAVKTSDNSSNFVAVAAQIAPVRANFSALNSAFGANTWVYLGTFFYGNNSDATTGVVSFIQSGNTTIFNNRNNATSPMLGMTLASASVVTTVTYTYSAGFTAGKIPEHLFFGQLSSAKQYDASGRGATYANAAGTISYGYAFDGGASAVLISTFWIPFTQGLAATGYNSAANCNWTINIVVFIDSALGVGSNPLF